MRIVVTDGFIDHRNKIMKKYKQGKRDDNDFIMNLDCELYEYEMITKGDWFPTDSWEIDGHDGINSFDVKFVPGKYWSISRFKLLNVLAQKGFVDRYRICRWFDHPGRPLVEGDEVEVEILGDIQYDTTLKSLNVSKHDGYYINLKEFFDV